MLGRFQTFLAFLQDLGGESYGNLFKKPFALLNQQGLRAREMFFTIPRAPAVTIYAGILWVIPLALLSSFEKPFMVAMGLSETEVGVYQNAAKLSGLFFLFLGGYLSDLWGRKNALIFFDSISWIGYCLCLALARDKWWCIGSIFFIWAVNAGSTSAYQCLLNEDVKSKSRPLVYSLLQLVNLVPSLLFPYLGGLWVARKGMTGACHEMYWLLTFLIMMGIGLRWKFLPQSGVYEKSSRTWLHAFTAGMRQYRDSFRRFFRKPVAAVFLFSKLLDDWTLWMWGTTYYSLYFMNHLKLNGKDFALINQSWAWICFLFLFFIMPHIRRKWVERILGLDQLIGLAGFGILLFLKPDSPHIFDWSLFSATLMALEAYFYGSVSTAVWMDIIGEKERAKVVAFATSLIAVCIAVSGLGGSILFGRFPLGLVWLIVGMRAVNFFLLRIVAGLLTKKG